ncbi:hypothetical protein HWV07_00885 [Natronomonas salina]|uniref:hypothetical protein n=1 Tax=Natronomonas salina TaxID=1710540 RepID=UPI0015B63135|nr:hypothetical protein [Natronomonas salina]QLD87665.1 hypothetical protein HWV07_00885 [Natronomonas salina]
MVDPLRLLRELFTGGGDDEAGADATEERPEAATDGGPPETGKHVYECPGCGEVYLNDAPHTCSNCGETTSSVAPSDD